MTRLLKSSCGWSSIRRRSSRRLGLPFNGLWDRPLHAIDCRALFYETDKYCRAAVPGLSSNRTRIKAKLLPATEPIELFFPPKWGINDRTPKGWVLGARGRRSKPPPPAHLP
jgi:hypothetical protein